MTFKNDEKGDPLVTKDALAALGVIVLCLPVFPIPVVLNEVAFVLSRWETMAGAAVVFLLSVHLLACSFSSGW